MIIPTAILSAVIEGFGPANPARTELGRANLNLSTVLVQFEKGLDWERSNRPQQFVGDRVGISLSPPNSPGGPPIRKVNFVSDLAAFVDLLPDKAFSRWAVANQRWLSELGQAAVLANDPVQARDFVNKVQHTLTSNSRVFSCNRSDWLIHRRKRARRRSSICLKGARVFFQPKHR
jgi:hypothetical protein